MGYAYLISWGLSYISLLGYQITGVAPILRTKGVLDPLRSSFNAEIDLITRLAQTYELRHLEYAQDCLTLLVRQLHSRTAWLVGVIDKVDLVPLEIMAYFSYQKILADHNQAILAWPLKAGDWKWFLSVFVVSVYLMATYFFSIEQRLDRLCIVLKHAVQAKKSVPSSDNGDSLRTPKGERPTDLSHNNF